MSRHYKYPFILARLWVNRRRRNIVSKLLLAKHRRLWKYLFFILEAIFIYFLLDKQESEDMKQSTNNRPIIGILSQEIHNSNVIGHIAASYVKYLEGAGARVVPIMINQDGSYYKKIFNSINGVFLPGGGRNLTTSAYGRLGKTFYGLAKEANKRGDYFPLWGTCLGFEFLAYLAGGRNILSSCNADNMAVPLQFTTDFKKSRMFSQAPHKILNTLATKPVTGEFHHICITTENFTAHGLDKEFLVTSVNQDLNDITYISSMESRKFPLYGVQFHPEKSLYEWTQKPGHDNIPHTPEAVEVSQFFANFFVNEARKNFHKFKDEEEEKKYLIYNYKPKYKGSVYQQIYLFSDTTHVV